jgi:membrane fusion protein, multidrug efflux system
MKNLTGLVPLSRAVRGFSNRRGWIGSSVLIATVVTTGIGLAAWKATSIQETNAAAANKPEPTEAVAVALAEERQHRRTTTSIGTVLALRSVTLRNELSGTVHKVALTPGQIVEEGTVLVALDVSVEEAELKAQEAQAALAETTLRRVQHLDQNQVTAATELDRARADRDVALAQVARIKAIIARKTIRAPFRARVGLADLHPGQYLNEGTQLTTLQGVDDAVHVDFTVPQRVAAGLAEDDKVEILAPGDSTSIEAKIVALDARVDPATRNAAVRARIANRERAPPPGASVRVQVPVGPLQPAVAVPVSALRKGPNGDHVFVIAPDKDGKPRAQTRRVESGAMLGDEVIILAGLSPGEQVAASGSFKLREAVLVAVARNTQPGTSSSAVQAQ